MKSKVELATDHLNVMTAIRPCPKPVKQKKGRRYNGIKRTSADAAFSNCIRERSNWTCERCGAEHPAPTTALHCSHFWGRGHWAVRHDPDNAEAFCYGCHRYFTANPVDYTEWKFRKLGEERYEILLEKKDNPSLAKQAHREEKEMAQHYIDQLAIMRRLRYAGLTGWLDFIGYL
jgi:hypothetical protein